MLRNSLAAAAALQVGEDLDRDRGVFGAEAIAFLGHAAEDLLRFGDPFDRDQVAAGRLGRDFDDRVAEPEDRQGEGEDHPDPARGAAAAWRPLRCSPEHYPDRRSPGIRNLRQLAVDTSAQRGKFSLPDFD